MSWRTGLRRAVGGVLNVSTARLTTLRRVGPPVVPLDLEAYRRLAAPAPLDTASLLCGRSNRGRARASSRSSANSGKWRWAWVSKSDGDAAGAVTGPPGNGPARSAGRPTGFRTYTHKTDFPADPVGPWTVDVLTPAGQLIGRVRFQVDP